jgi:hypothetical protein
VSVAAANVVATHAAFAESIRIHFKRRSIDTDHWDRIRQDFTAAYVRGDISDNEHDDLLNRWRGVSS